MSLLTKTFDGTLMAIKDLPKRNRANYISLACLMKGIKRRLLRPEDYAEEAEWIKNALEIEYAEIQEGLIDEDIVREDGCAAPLNSCETLPFTPIGDCLPDQFTTETLTV